MVYLTMTSTIVEALEKIQSFEKVTDGGDQSETQVGSSRTAEHQDAAKTSLSIDEKVQDLEITSEDEEKQSGSLRGTGSKVKQSIEPSLSDPKSGNPISHGQVIDLSRQLKAYGLSPRTLDLLLRGARVYVAPPPTKPEPTSEYKTLMARLRREEEARSYERLINPPPPMETFAQRFPMSSAAHAFSSFQQPDPEDEIVYADIDKQIAVVANVLLSIICCAVAIWVVAKWWSTPARLALSMSGSLLVGVAEVVIYGGYLKRVGEAKAKEKDVREIKEVVRTWVVGGGEDEPEESVLMEKQDLDDVRARRRRKDPE